jgi:glyoxylase I family protein
VGLSCKDPIKLERFYTKHFGFKRARVYAPGPDQTVIIRKGPMAIEFLRATAEKPQDLPWGGDGPAFPTWRHIAFLVDDLDAVLAQIGDEAPVTLGPIDFSAFIPNHRTAWITDPEGNVIELNQGFVDEENPPPFEG